MIENRNKTPMPKRRFNPKATIVVTGLAVFSLIAGLAGGFYAYNAMNPEAVVLSDSKGFDFATVEKAQTGKDVVGSFSDPTQQAVALVNAAFYQESQKPYVLSYESQAATSAGVTQVIEGVSYHDGVQKTAFNQSTSYSPFIQTADRTYVDAADLKVSSYHGKTPSDWATAQAIERTPEAFLDTQGKLPVGFYHLAKAAGSDGLSFAGFGLDLSGQGIKNQTGYTGYEIDASTVLKDSVQTETTADGYRVSLGLDVKTGVKLMARQMKATGGLTELPIFDSVSLTVELTDGLSLTKMATKASYKAKSSAFPVAAMACTSTDTVWFFASDAPFKDANGTALSAPKPSEDTATGESNKNESALVKMARAMAGSK